MEIVHVPQKIPKQRILKRKLRANADNQPVKRQKLHSERLTVDGLPWKVVSRPSAAGIDEAGGMLMLEEVEGVEVSYEETPNGRVVKFKQVSPVPLNL